MKKQDIIFAVITGLTTGFSVWQIFAYLRGTSILFGIHLALLLLVVPVLWVFGVWFGYFLSRWFAFFRQFGKFVAVGFANASVDFGILYILIALTGVASGMLYSVFKAISFSISAIHSYMWNRHWVFGAGKKSANIGEFATFMGVAIVAIVINVGVASVVVNYIGGPYFQLNSEAWAGVGAVAGSASALALSFTGFKLIVFKR